MTDIRTTLQQSLGGAYTIERELGGGGMSRTYVAEETSLHRRVVVKVLSPDLAAGVSVDRFKREIQLAAALQHPHIVPVLAAGDTNGLPYYTMPFVAGESLRVRLARGPLSVTETVGVLRDVAKALAFAHAEGVVHRDIKPDNVLLSGGSATVADFGIAKAISAARTDAPNATLTQVGTSLGTPAYMAPEQAAGDPDTDHRADIYAFGVMAYEMLAGQAPFHGLTPQRMLAAHMAERPRAISDVRPDIPATMSDLVMRCLEKEASARPQSAADIVRYLDTVTSGSGQTANPSVLLGGNVSLGKALAYYTAAFVVVAVLARAAIVGVGLPDWVFTGAIIVMALGLPAILLTAYVQRVDYGVAREIATREGIKAVIDGDIVSLGGSYVLSARLVSAQTGEDLATFRETADHDKDIIPAISRLSKSLRAKLGESLRTVQSAKTLDKVTTPSLEALQRYVAANRAIEVDGDFARFTELMDQAIALDTGFAMAYRKLAVELNNRGLQRPRVEELLQKAYNHMDRLSDTERYILLGTYWTNGPRQDISKAASALESLLEIDSANVTALNNLAVLYHLQQEYAKQELMAERAVRVQPTAAVFFNNLVHSRVHQGKIEEARAAIAIAQQNIPRNPDVAFMRTEVLDEEFKTDSSDLVLDSLTKARPNDLPTVARVSFDRGAIRAFHGRLAEGGRYRAEARSMAARMGNPQAAVNAILDSADADSWFRDQRDRALRAVDRAAAHPNMASMSPAQRPYPRFVLLYSRLGRTDKARPYLDEMSPLPRFQNPDGQRSVAEARGAIARADRRFDDAIRDYRAAVGGGCADCGLPELAMTYDQAGQPDSAIAIYTRYTQGRAIALGHKATWLALTHKRLGELYDGKGNIDSALSQYARFVELWKNADPDLQPQVQKARARMLELQRRRG